MSDCLCLKIDIHDDLPFVCLFKPIIALLMKIALFVKKIETDMFLNLTGFAYLKWAAIRYIYFHDINTYNKYHKGYFAF